MCKYFRFIKDVKYDLLVPPLGLDVNSFTAAQAREYYQWFILHLPERTAYLCQRCAADLHLPPDQLNLSPESLRLLWKWFLQTARMEKTPRSRLLEMRQEATLFGESFLNRQQLSVATTFILRDIAMYVGQVFVSNHPPLSWSYFTKPRSSVDVNYPIISGFKTMYMQKESSLYFQPLRMVEVQAANLFDRTAEDSDLFRVYAHWLQYVPHK